MKLEFYLQIAASGQRMPIGTDLLIFEEADPEEARCVGGRLGRIIEPAARRYKTPLAIPLMDPRLDKAGLLARIGVPAGKAGLFHFAEPPGDGILEAATRTGDAPFPAGRQAHIEAIRYVATRTDLLPIGMLIGPFSLLTTSTTAAN